MDDDDPTAWFIARQARFREIARGIVGSRADAEDVVQDAWLKAGTRPTDPLRSRAAWFATTVRHLAIDRVRHRRVVRLHADATRDDPGHEPSTEERAALRAEAMAMLARMTSRLDDVAVVAVLLREVFGEDYATLARLANRSEGAMRVMVHRALERLRRDEREPSRPDRPIDAICRQALVRRDARMLHAALVELRTATTVEAAARPIAGPRVRIAVVLVGGRPVLAWRQGATLICPLPVAEAEVCALFD